MESDYVKMSPKGQLVVPQDIRQSENFEPGDKFMAISVKDGVLFKKIEMPNIKIEFEKLSKDIEKKFKRNKINKKDIEEAIKWARK
ncbi:hypothetical protein J4476_05345 [Candidatus Woesearchaeota archaeon]|nr:MAG: hypothetical protein QT09_C0017G0018 [archaeon GW2011_AR18]MBS3162090.1 hypothetical protein [Candidatus Woesearchaeota archaeon]HIH25279.1 hypothetical protein [Nanoarchaeota archaeon]